MTRFYKRYILVLIMETSTLAMIKIFRDKGITWFTVTDFSRILEITDQNTVYKKLQRLEKKTVIKKLLKGKYLFLFGKINDFTMANFLYQPSYVSLESALSFYGIITGFSYKITSISLKKTKNLLIDNKELSYSQIDKELFFGYEKKDNFLIAEPEKAIFDYIYFSQKGLRSRDLSEFDLSGIDKPKLNHYLKKINYKL